MQIDYSAGFIQTSCRNSSQTLKKKKKSKFTNTTLAEVLARFLYKLIFTSKISFIFNKVKFNQRKNKFTASRRMKRKKFHLFSKFKWSLPLEVRHLKRLENNKKLSFKSSYFHILCSLSDLKARFKWQDNSFTEITGLVHSFTSTSFMCTNDVEETFSFKNMDHFF